MHAGEGDPGRVFIAWGLVSGRAQELATELSAEVLELYPAGVRNRPGAIRRYLLSTARTIAFLARRRPSVVIVVNPPVVPALLSQIYASLSHARVIIDDHPGAFGAMGYRPGRWLQPLHRWAAKRAAACLVTDEVWAEQVKTWGGTGLILHESPRRLTPVPYAPPGGRARILFASTFARDEPVEEVIDAAELLPELDVQITGDWTKKPPRLALANVTLTGLLPEDEYHEILRRADVVLSLTTEPTSAMRAAFEAIWTEKVLVVSDWPLTRTLFPTAIHVRNEAADIVRGLRFAVAHHQQLASELASERKRQISLWDVQIERLLALALEGGASR